MEAEKRERMTSAMYHSLMKASVEKGNKQEERNKGMQDYLQTNIKVRV